MLCVVCWVQSACWGPDGQLLLFALEDDPTLYYLSFYGNDSGSSMAIKCADLSPHIIPDGDGDTDNIV